MKLKMSWPFARRRLTILKIGAHPAPIRRRRLADLALNALFLAWTLHIVVTGSLIPAPLDDLLHPDHPVAAVSEPIEAPSALTSIV